MTKWDLSIGLVLSYFWLIFLLNLEGFYPDFGSLRYSVKEIVRYCELQWYFTALYIIYSKYHIIYTLWLSWCLHQSMIHSVSGKITFLNRLWRYLCPFPGHCFSECKIGMQKMPFLIFSSLRHTVLMLSVVLAITSSWLQCWMVTVGLTGIWKSLDERQPGRNSVCCTVCLST